MTVTAAWLLVAACGAAERRSRPPQLDILTAVGLLIRATQA